LDNFTKLTKTQVAKNQNIEFNANYLLWLLLG